MTVGDDRTATSPNERARGELAPGTVLGGYRIEAVAGRGGMGVVYRARQLSLGRTVALKVIDPLLAGDPVFRRRFENESALAASLDHPNVVTVHEAGEDQGRLFVSMRFIPGRDLGKLLAAEGPLDPARAGGLVAGVADALDAAHAAGLVHRDVKPSNVLVERRPGGEQAFLSDFGVVKRIGADAQRTGSAGWVGTADFVAPEQVLGGSVDARTDVYALGGVLYTALTGRVPFERPDIAGKLYASVNEPVPPLRQSRRELPAAVDGVIARATAKDPAARYASAGEFAAAAQAVLATAASASAIPTPEDASPTGAPAATDGTRRWRRPAAIGAAGLALAAVIAVVVLATSSGGSQHPRQGGAAQRTSARPGASAKAGTPPSSAAVKGAATAPPKTVASGYYTTPWTNGPNSYRVSIYGLRRDGPFLELDFGVRCLRPNPGCEVVQAFEPGYEVSSQRISLDGGTPAGVALVDPAELKKYLTVRDAEDRPYTSRFPQGAEGIQDSLIHLQWVRYPAPPTGTTSLDVVFPDGGLVIPHVPITNGPAPAAGGQLQAAPSAPFSAPAGGASTAGLTLPVQKLVADSGNATGSDSESPGQAQLTVSSDVLFQFDKSTLTPKAKAVLQSVAQQIKSRARGTVQVTGYTDSIGTNAVNIPLSQARARSVVRALTPLTQGITYTFQGLGSADPVAPNTEPNGSDNPAGRALNRRVTITFAAAAARPTPPPQAATSAGGSADQTGSMTFPGFTVGQGGNYRVSNPVLYRDGNLLVLSLTVGCAQSNLSNGCVPALDLAGIGTVPPQPVFGGGPNSIDPQAVNSLSGFYLLDPAKGSEYIPIRGTDRTPLTSDLNIANVPVGASYQEWIYFPAPPATTSSLTLVSPQGTSEGTFDPNAARLGPIPVSDRAPATP